MPATRNLCAQLPLDLHAKVCEAREASGLTTAQYITNLLTEYYKMKENGGKTIMAANTRTMAFQISEELFQRIKVHLERETACTGHKLTLPLHGPADGQHPHQGPQDTPSSVERYCSISLEIFSCV